LPKIVVTGGSGKAGRACIRDLQAHGYDVLNIDRTPPEQTPRPFMCVDLTDYGQVVGALAGPGVGAREVSAVVHLAAMRTRVFPDPLTFANNVVSTYNVFEACRLLGIRNVVWASSDSILGVPYDEPPAYVPEDEESAVRPENDYALSKVLCEEMARQFCRRDPSMKMVGLRFSNIMAPEDYDRFASFQGDARTRKWNLWGYVDVRDAAQAVRKALEAPIKGAEVFCISSEDTVMEMSDSELMKEVFPGVPVRKELGRNEALHSIEKARRVLGYRPEFGWRRPKGGLPPPES
jgi:nucleoside-diphosphate-sugar epimerase